MAKYSLELKARARDYYEIHSNTLEQISQTLDVPKTTLSDWKKNQGWIKGSLQSKVTDAKQKLRDEITDNKVFNKVKDELVAEMKANNPAMTTTTVEEDVIIEQRAVSILIEACSVENFDALAMEGVKLAYKKLKYMNNLPLEKVSMNEIKVFNDIVGNTKTQVFGKEPDTVINLSNQNMNIEDYSKMSTDQLHEILSKANKEKALEAAPEMM